MFKKIQLKRREVLLPLLALLFNFCSYFIGRFAGGSQFHWNLTLPLDEAIPFLSWTVIFYWGCAPIWAINYVLGVKYDKGCGNRFILAHFLGEVVCFLFFIFFPTTMVRPEITGHSIFDWVMTLTYTIDAPDNLLPSIHCFVSWLSYLAVRNNPHIPRWYRLVSLLIASAICISTLTVKQHVLLDLISGVALAELSYLVSGWLDRTLSRASNRTKSAQ